MRRTGGGNGGRGRGGQARTAPTAAAAAPPTNVFGVLASADEGKLVVPTGHRRATPEAGRKQNKPSNKKAQPKPSASKAAAEVFDLVDDFILTLIFSHLRDGPSLARVRQVCTRWRDVLDADEKLWPGLLLTEFKWKKTERRGKGRNKKNKKMEQINYREQYGKLYREHEATMKIKKMKEGEELAKISRLMRCLVPIAIDLQMSHLKNERHPWLLCSHPPEWLDVSKRALSKYFVPTPPVAWCQCRACDAELDVLKLDEWKAKWPHLLEWTTYNAPDKIADLISSGVLQLALKWRYYTPGDRVGGAYDTYADFLVEAALERELHK